MKRILVIGGNGQLGHCLQKLAPKYHDQYDFNFTGSSVLDITNYEQVDTVFAEYQPDFVINASAYTAVDLAEKEVKMLLLSMQMVSEIWLRFVKITMQS